MITMGVILISLPWTVQHITHYSRQVIENASNHALPEPVGSITRSSGSNEPISLVGE